MFSNTFNWNKVSNFFTIGSHESSREDGEQYQSIGGGTAQNPYMDDEMIQSHNISSGDKKSGRKNGTDGGSSMVVDFDELTRSDDDWNDSDSNSSNSNDDNIKSTNNDLNDSIGNIDGKSPALLGMILVTISAVCYAALNLSVKALMDETPWQELMIIRMGITWIATMAWILVKYRGQMSLWGPRDKRLLLTWRAFFLWGAMFCCWWSFEFLPVGDGTTLAMSFPMWVAVIAHFVFRNDDTSISPDSHLTSRLDKYGWICVFSGLIGVIFVAQPSFLFGGDLEGPARDVGVILGLCSAICAGAQYVIVNYTKEDCHWLQVEQITAFLSTFILMPIGIAVFAVVRYYNTGVFTIGLENLNGARWCEEIALGLLGFTALALLTRGSQLDAPARTAICLYLQIPVTYAGQCLMTQTFPNAFVFIGIILVLVSVIVPAVRKLNAAKKAKMERLKLKEEEKIRRKMMQGNGTDMARNSNLRGNGMDSDEAGTSESEAANSNEMARSERDALLDKYRKQGIVNDMNDVPKYTVNVSNSSLIASVGARNGRSKRYKRYDYQSSSSDDSL